MKRTACSRSHFSLRNNALLGVVYLALMILPGCENPVTSNSSDTSGPDETPSADSPTPAVSSTRVVAWQPASGEGTWKGWTELERSDTLLLGTIDLTETGETRFHVYDFDATGILQAIGFTSYNVQSDGSSTTHQFTFDAGTLTLATARAGSVQGRTLALTRYANAIAGTGNNSGSTDGTFQDGTKFNKPWGITTDGASLFITDYQNHTIRRMEIATGQVTTLAGSAGEAGFTNAEEGTDARFQLPRGITYHDGLLYVADGNRATGPGTRVRTVDPDSGQTSTLIDTGSSLIDVVDLTVADGGLYLTDFYGNSVYRYDLADGDLAIFAGQVSNSGAGGTTGLPDSQDGTGSEARFKNPWGITSDGTYLYVVDTNDNAVRRIEISTAEVTTIIRNDGQSYLYHPAGITTDGEHIYVSDLGDNRIREILLTSEKTFSSIDDVAGKEGTDGTNWGTGTVATFGEPNGITTDGINLFITDRKYHIIRKIQ